MQFKKEFPINKTKHTSQRRAMRDVTASEKEQELQMVHVQLKTEERTQTLCTSVKNALNKLTKCTKGWGKKQPMNDFRSLCKIHDCS